MSLAGDGLFPLIFNFAPRLMFRLSSSLRMSRFLLCCEEWMIILAYVVVFGEKLDVCLQQQPLENPVSGVGSNSRGLTAIILNPRINVSSPF